MDAPGSLEELYPYHIVEFISPGRRPQIRKVDVVATKWLTFDVKKKKLLARYPSPPYTNAIFNQLNTALKNLSDALCTWNTYTVKPKGKAKNLDEAFKKLELLKEKDTAYTMSSDDSYTEVEKTAEEELRKNEFSRAALAFKSALSQPPVPKENNQDGFLQRSSSMSHPSQYTSRGFKRSTTAVKNKTSPLNEITNTTAGRNKNNCNSQKQTIGSTRAQNLSAPPAPDRNLIEPRETLSPVQFETALSSQAETASSTQSSDTALSVQSTVQTVTVSSVCQGALSSTDSSVQSNPPVQNGTGSFVQHKVNDGEISSFANNSAILFANDKGVPDISASNLAACDVPPSRFSNSSAKVSLYQVLIGYLVDIKNNMSLLQTDVKEIKSDLGNLRKALSKNVNSPKEFIGTIQQLCSTFNYKIPFATIEEFQTFNQNLQEDESLHEAVSTVLQTGLDPSLVISRSIVNMLKMFLTKQVASKYVAVKRVKDKFVMKPTPFFQCVEVLIKQRRLICKLDTPDKDMISALSAVLSNSGTWYTSKKSDTSTILKQKRPSNQLNEENYPEFKMTEEDHDQSNSESLDDEGVSTPEDEEPPTKLRRHEIDIAIPQHNSSNNDVELITEQEEIFDNLEVVDQSLLQENSESIKVLAIEPHAPNPNEKDPMLFSSFNEYEDDTDEDDFSEAYLRNFKR